jgi:hypothetical protein
MRILPRMLLGFVLGIARPTSAGDAEPPGPRSVIDRGAVVVAATAEPGAISLADLVTISVEVRARRGIDAILPPTPASLPGFALRREKRPPLRRDGEFDVVRVEWTLEPEATGELSIPSFTVRCEDRRATGRDGDAAASFEIVTDPLRVRVTSLLGEAEPSLDDVPAPLAPLGVEVPGDPLPRYVPYVALGVVALALGMLLLRRRDKAVPEPVPLTPAERARLEFESLLRDDPLARLEYSAFYSELTLIVRRYIERTTGVRAGEQTTEEFLREMRSHAAFDQGARERLSQFLVACDLVKFAAARPQRDEVEEAFRRAQEFAAQREPLRLAGAGGSR